MNLARGRHLLLSLLRQFLLHNRNAVCRFNRGNGIIALGSSRHPKHKHRYNTKYLFHLPNKNLFISSICLQNYIIFSYIYI